MIRDVSHNTVILVKAADGSRTTECRFTSVKPESFPTLSEVEEDHILLALRQSEWNCINAAKLLGIDRSTLYRKIKRYELKQS
jgi:transcriptional regulator of acetoin/glycerol metabolism